MWEHVSPDSKRFPPVRRVGQIVPKRLCALPPCVYNFMLTLIAVLSFGVGVFIGVFVTDVWLL